LAAGDAAVGFGAGAPDDDGFADDPEVDEGEPDDGFAEDTGALVDGTALDDDRAELADEDAALADEDAALADEDIALDDGNDMTEARLGLRYRQVSISALRLATFASLTSIAQCVAIALMESAISFAWQPLLRQVKICESSGPLQDVDRPLVDINRTQVLPHSATRSALCSYAQEKGRLTGKLQRRHGGLSTRRRRGRRRVGRH
jgi:hypothetical protein